MINHIDGNLLDTYCQAIVNPCNCKGVGGAGVSLQLKMEAPENFRIYRDACLRGMLVPGKCLVVPTDEISENVKFIINLPTKDDWRNPSKEEYIRSGLDDLVHKVRTWGIDSVAIPALGAGCGGMYWKDVQRIILEQLASHDCDVEERIYAIYNPYLRNRK